uniref:Uncharacterized protein n=1 Tax=Myoviridae sp. ctjhW4 TaxID=2825162 RepID=A0A8S5PTW2_9CAUD|nr:MAG TPA: hypothetical protein [Myoviridae sp. ctjhW4]
MYYKLSNQSYIIFHHYNINQIYIFQETLYLFHLFYIEPKTKELLLILLLGLKCCFHFEK